MIRGLLILFVCVFAPKHLVAGEAFLSVDLAEDRVDISTAFDGAYLSLFGVKEKDGQVTVVVRGPKKDMVVREKKRTGGVWMNRQSVQYKDVPQFYDFALSDAEDSILDAETRKAAGIGFEALKFSTDEKLSEQDHKNFQQALVRNKQEEGLFPFEAKDIVFLSDTFFKTRFYVPANVPVGEFVIETFLIDDGAILDRHSTQVKIAQVGFSSGVYRFAHSYSFAYAIFIIMIAVVAGWLSNAVRQNNK